MKTFAFVVSAMVLNAAPLVLHAQEAPPNETEKVKEQKEKPAMQKITTFLMFEGKAEEAVNFYISLFKSSKIVAMSKYGKEGPGAEGSVKLVRFSLDGQEFMAIDSPAKHAFTFTPAVSLYVKCSTKEEIDELFKKLSDGGQVMMPLEEYPFSERFAWVSDKYGVSWQISLEK